MTPSPKPLASLRSRLLLGAGLLLVAGLLAEWRLAAPSAVSAPAAAPPAVAAPAAPAPAAPAAQPAEASAALTSVEPGAAAPPAVVDDGPPGTPHENDPIEPELPQTPAWKLEKTAHLHTLMDRHAQRLEAERVAAQAAGRTDEAQRLEVAVGRAQRRLVKLRAEMDSLQAQVAAGGDAAQ